MCTCNVIVEHLEHSDRIYFLHSVSWSYQDLTPATLHVYCDVSPLALGFWYPSLNLGFQAEARNLFKLNGESIFYLEVLCVCAAMLDTATCIPKGGCLAVFTNNINMVQLFNSLEALPTFRSSELLTSSSQVTLI